MTAEDTKGAAVCGACDGTGWVPQRTGLGGGTESCRTCRQTGIVPPSAYLPEVGDRVRIVLEGRVRPAVQDKGFLVGDVGVANYIAPSAAHVVSVEKLPDPEPDYRPGDVVRLNGEHAATYPGQDIFLMHTDYQWRNAYGQDSTDGFMGCDVTLLVRGGESVAAGGGNG